MNNADTYRPIVFQYDHEAGEMRITYNPENVAGSKTELAVCPWPGFVDFLVDESVAADCPNWIIVVEVAGTPPGRVSVRYALREFGLLGSSEFGFPADSTRSAEPLV